MALVLSVISLCLCVAFFFFFRGYIARKTSAEILLADYRAEVFRLIAEIDAATDRDSILVEERVKTLRQLIEDTDRRIAIYMREQQRGRRGDELYNSLGRGIRAALDSGPPEIQTAIGGTAAETVATEKPVSPDSPHGTAKPHPI